MVEARQITKVSSAEQLFKLLMNDRSDLVLFEYYRGSWWNNHLNAKAASVAKSKFLMSMSHDLHTPLNAIIGFSQLQEFDSETLTPDQNMAVNDIHHGGMHLLKLVELMGGEIGFYSRAGQDSEF